MTEKEDDLEDDDEGFEAPRLKRFVGLPGKMKASADLSRELSGRSRASRRAFLKNKDNRRDKRWT